MPFIARYRKEATDGLDDIQLRELEARLAYLRELEDRRAAVLKSIDEQGKLTPELRAAIEAAPTKQELEDLYLPYKPQAPHQGHDRPRGGPGAAGRQAVRRPVAGPAGRGDGLRRAFRRINAAEAGFADAPAVLDGVRDLLSERWAEDAALVGKLREWLWAEGLLQSKLVDGKDGTHPDAAKFRDYFDYAEPIRTVPAHRALAVFRGRTQEWLDAKLVLDEEVRARASRGWPRAASRVHLGWRHAQRPADELIRKTIAWTWKVKLSLSLERDLFAPPARSRRSRRDQGLRRQPARPAAGRTRRQARGDGAGPGHPHRRARWRWSATPARCWTPPPSTRTSRAATGKARCTRWAGWWPRTAST